MRPELDASPAERVAIGEAIEQELQGRNHRPAESPENFPELPKGDTRDLAAKAADQIPPIQGIYRCPPATG